MTSKYDRLGDHLAATLAYKRRKRADISPPQP